MLRAVLSTVTFVAGFQAAGFSLMAQERVKPRAAQGGEKQGVPWEGVPENFRNLKIPEWPLPTDLKQWQEVGRPATRATLLRQLGEMPAGPDPKKVRIVSREDHGDYTLERFEFHNGVDSDVPGILLIPKNVRRAAPAIIALHGHGSSKESVCTDSKSSQFIGPTLARNGYVVAAIDAYFNGDRVGSGPAGRREDKGGQEATLFKLHLWQGRTLWGMMLRDEQCLIDYLETRPDVDRRRIAATGMSMGCTRSWWLAAVDDRIQAIVGVACFTRFTELIAHGNIAKHGIYYFVPGLLQHFDTEAIYALVAPRPMLLLSGDQDGGAPTDGIEVLESKLGAVYRLHGKAERFRSIVYENTGHEYLPEMKEEMLAWFQRHLPPDAGPPLAPPPTVEVLRQDARAVLAQLDGEIRLPGLTEPVEVLRDRWGVPHIYARNQHDLFFTQGFVAAQDRLFQLDVWRRIAVGETAAVLGPAGLERDRFARLFRYRRDMPSEWTSYSPDTEEIATAFTQGINACIDHLGDRLPIEFKLLGLRASRWRPEDVLGRMSGVGMVRNFTSEIKRAALVAAVGVERARRIAPTDPATDYGPVPGLDLAGIDRAILRPFEAATAGLQFEPGQAGSNNWVVDGTLSASGRPMLANDPHRPFMLPSLRYLVHLHAPGWNVIGAGEPALPGVAVGHNEEIAWGITIVNTDQCDLYVEETNPADPAEYRIGGRWEKMEVVREEVPVRGETQPATVELRYTRHGPVIHQDRDRHRAYALRWAGAEAGGAGYLGSLALNRAKNWDQFRRALSAWKVPSENVVYADRQGNIGWVATALTPIRSGWNGLLPVPGAEGRYEWQGFLKVEEYPQEYNPARHFIVTANSKILPPGYPHEISYEWTHPFRYARLRQLFEAQRRFTMADFRNMQHDVTSLPGQALSRLAGAVRIDDPALAEQAAKVASWDGVLSRDSIAGPLYAVWLTELLAEFYRPHVPPDSLEYVSEQRGTEVMLPALENPDEAWLGENPRARRDELLRTSLAVALRKIAPPRDATPGPLNWGQYRQFTFRHPLEKLGGTFGEAYNLGPIARVGDRFTPNPTSISSTGVVSGASFREIYDLSDWDLALVTNVPGQSGQPGAAHYSDLLPLWNEGEYFPLKFTRPAVEQVTQHRLLLRP